MSTEYISQSTNEVYGWLKAGLCVWCGGKCPGDQCRLRKCDSCTELWIADSLRDLEDGQVPHEYCPPCQAYLNQVHAVNPSKMDHIVCGSLIDAEIKVDNGAEVTCPNCMPAFMVCDNPAPTFVHGDQ